MFTESLRNERTGLLRPAAALTMARASAAGAFTAASLLISQAAWAYDPNRKLPASVVPYHLRGANITENLGASLDSSLLFADETGQIRPLRDYIAGRPVLLTVVYYKCPSLCNFHLNGLFEGAEALSRSPFGLKPGKDYSLIVVSMDDRERPALAAAKKKAYLSRFKIGAVGESFWANRRSLESAGETSSDSKTPVGNASVAPAAPSGDASAVKNPAFAARGNGSAVAVQTPSGADKISPDGGLPPSVSFLTGGKEAIQSLTDRLGFSFRWDEETEQFAHSPVAYALSSKGVIVRYLYGVRFDRQKLRLSLAEAKRGSVLLAKASKKASASGEDFSGGADSYKAQDSKAPAGQTTALAAAAPSDRSGGSQNLISETSGRNGPPGGQSAPGGGVSGGDFSAGSLSVTDRILLFCYRFDPSQNRYTLAAYNIMRAGAGLTALLLAAFLLPFWLRQKNR